MKARSLLRPLLGRERPTWRALPWPRLRRSLFRDDIDCLIFALITARPRVFFVQIGSHDGRSGDPLWTFRRFPNWQGLLVEPVDYLFQRLVANYAPWHARFRFENAALASESGARTFHYIAQSADLPAGYDQLGSFDLDLLQRNARYFAGAETRVVSADVRCLSWQDLCARHDVHTFDLLHIDAEGADGEILEQIDLDRCRPSIVMYEHVHMPQPEQQRIARRLAEFYDAVCIGIDTVAIRRADLATMPALAAAWHLITRA